MASIRRRPLPEFKIWLSAPDAGYVETRKTLSARMSEQATLGGTPAEFVELTQHALRGNERLNRAFDADVEVVLTAENPNCASFKNLELYQNQSGAALSKLRIRRLVIGGVIAEGKPIVLSDCWIDFLHLANTHRLQFNECYIGTVWFDRRVGDIVVRGGAVLGVTCAAAHEETPFTASVNFKNVYFPREPGDRLTDAQPYRNLRAHMMRLENTPMLSLFHTLEQAVERKQETNTFNRFVSWMYELLSDYGSSIGRPAAWFLSLMVLTCLVMASFGGAAPGRDLRAWQLGLANTSHWRAVERSALLTLQGTLNPLGIFGTSMAVAPASGWAAAWMFVHSVLSTILAALFILALRRRFKMS